jgi:hypothetical protein
MAQSDIKAVIVKSGHVKAVIVKSGHVLVTSGHVLTARPELPIRNARAGKENLYD